MTGRHLLGVLLGAIAAGVLVRYLERPRIWRKVVDGIDVAYSGSEWEGRPCCYMTPGGMMVTKLGHYHAEPLATYYGQGAKRYFNSRLRS